LKFAFAPDGGGGECRNAIEEPHVVRLEPVGDADVFTRGRTREERPHPSLGYLTPARFAASCTGMTRPNGADARRRLQLA
jgi:hypothetical protein